MSSQVALQNPPPSHAYAPEPKRIIRSNLWWLLLKGFVIALCTFVALGGSALIGTSNTPLLIIAVVIAILAGLFIALHPEFGLYVLVAFVYLNLSDVLEVSFGFVSTNKPIVGLMFVGTMAHRIAIHRKPLAFRVTEIVILCNGLVMLASVFVATYPSDALNAVEDWMKDFAILFIVLQLASDEQVWKRIQWILILSAALVSFLGVYQNITGDYANEFYGLANAPVAQITGSSDAPRIAGPISDPNFYAQILLMTMPIAAYRMMTEKKFSLRLAGGICFSLIAAAAVLTYSRSAFLALIIVCVLIIRERKLNPYKIAGVIALILLIVTPILPGGYLDRIMTLNEIIPGQTNTGPTDASFIGRSSEMQVGIIMFLDHPFLGVGVANFVDHYQEYSQRLGLDSRTEQRNAHSLYFQMAAETGVCGLIAFTLVMLVIFGGLIRARRKFIRIGREDLVPWVYGLQFGLTSYLLTSIFLHGAFSRYMWLLVGFCASCSLLAEILTRQYEQTKRERSGSSEQNVFFTRELIKVER